MLRSKLIYYLIIFRTMEPVDNNQFEVKTNLKNKRKLPALCTNVYLNPGLDLLANEDPMCNNALEIVPVRKRRRTKSCDIAAFENSALDLGISKSAVNEFLARELENVRKNVRSYNITSKVSSSHEAITTKLTEPIYANLNSSDPCTALPRNNNSGSQEMTVCVKKSDETINNVDMDSGISILEQKSFNHMNTFDNELSTIDHIDTSADVGNKTNVTNHIFVNNQTNLSLSFIDRLALDNSTTSNQSLYLDDDLNESNIMEIKTITIITKKKRLSDKKINTNPFLNQSTDENVEDLESVSQENPFLSISDTTSKAMEVEYEPMSQPTSSATTLVPKILFTSDINNTISTINESMPANNQNEYENMDDLRSESPIYENIGDDTVYEPGYNKQSKILGCDVSHFNATDIINLNKLSTQVNNSNDSNDSKKDFKHQLSKATKLSKLVFKKLKQTFKHEKQNTNTTLNPYEVPRKTLKPKSKPKDSGIENPALNLDNSDEIEIEEIEEDDEEHQYETIKTLRNTKLNMNVTPLKERVNEPFNYSTRVATPGKKQVRFDSTLNQEKVITGNSFDCDIASPGFDTKIDKYHDELENCINEKKFINQNM